MGEKERADLDWLYRRDPETVAKDQAKADREGREYTLPDIPRARTKRRTEAAAIETPTPSRRPARIAPAPSREPAPVPADAPVRHPLPTRQPAPAPAPSVAPTRTATRAPRPRRRRHPIRNTLALLLVLLLGAGVYLAGIPLMAWGQIERVDSSPSGKRPAGHPGTAILLVGSDARSDLTDAEKTELKVGDTEDGSARTDSMMLLYKPPSGRSVLISIPRDSWVEIPGQGEGKINAAFALGGPELLVATIEAETGFRIDGYAEVGMGGLARVVKALDGIDVCVEHPVAAELDHEAIAAGCQRLDATQALWFVRARHNDAEGDIGRVARQRQFLSAIMKQTLTPSVVLNPSKYRATTDAVSNGIALGQDTGIGDALALAQGMRNISSGAGFSMVLPIADPAGWSSDGQSIVVLDDDRVAGLFAQLNKGDTTNLEKYVG